MERQIPVPETIRRLMAVLEARGFEVCAVGGCVRDSLLGRTPSDWDLCTSALPEETMAAFARTIPTGILHGTVTVIWEGEPVELTTYRVDGTYSDSRRPDSVAFTRTLEEDLSRRDFTVNAMACRRDGVVIDLFDGFGDLSRRCIRCVGDARKRFDEDALRILRALRFASRLDFQLEETTGEAALALREHLNRIAPERLWKELSGLLSGEAAGRVCMEYTPILETVLGLSLSGETAAALSSLAPDPALRLAWLLYRSKAWEREPPSALARTVSRRLRMDNRTLHLLTLLLEGMASPLPGALGDARRLAGKVGGEAALGLAALHRLAGAEESRCAQLEQVILRGDCVTIGQLAVTGETLLAEGIPAGPAVGAMLRRLLELVMDGAVPNERDALRKFLRDEQSR